MKDDWSNITPPGEHLLPPRMDPADLRQKKEYKTMGREEALAIAQSDPEWEKIQADALDDFLSLEAENNNPELKISLQAAGKKPNLDQLKTIAGQFGLFDEFISQDLALQGFCSIKDIVLQDQDKPEK